MSDAENPTLLKSDSKEQASKAKSEKSERRSSFSTQFGERIPVMTLKQREMNANEGKSDYIKNVLTPMLDEMALQ